MLTPLEQHLILISLSLQDQELTLLSRATIYLEDNTPANSAMVTDEGIVVRASGAPLLPDFLFLIVPGSDGDKVALGTGGANTLRFTVAAPAGSGNYVATVDFTED